MLPMIRARHSKSNNKFQKYLEFTKLMLNGMETLKQARLKAEPKADVQMEKTMDGIS